MKKTILGVLLLTSVHAYAQNDLADLTDCEYSKRMIDEATPLMLKAVSFVDKTDYREIAQWRVKEFNPTISRIEDSYRLTPQEATSSNRSISNSVRNDFVIRTKLLVQTIYNHVRNDGDKSEIKEQWQIIKKTASSYAEQCESSSI